MGLINQSAFTPEKALRRCAEESKKVMHEQSLVPIVPDSSNSTCFLLGHPAQQCKASRVGLSDTSTTQQLIEAANTFAFDQQALSEEDRAFIMTASSKQWVAALCAMHRQKHGLSA